MRTCDTCCHVAPSDGSCSKGLVAEEGCKHYQKAQYCQACGIFIRPFSRETSLHQVDTRLICGRCYSELQRYGFLRLTELTFMLPDGQITRDKPQAFIDLMM